MCKIVSKLDGEQRTECLNYLPNFHMRVNKNYIFVHSIGSVSIYIHTSCNLQGQRATLPLNNHRFVVRAECLNTLPTYHMREAKQKRYSYKVAL